MALQIVSEISKSGEPFTDLNVAKDKLYQDVPQGVEDLVQSMKDSGKIIDESFSLSDSGSIHHVRTFVDESAYVEYSKSSVYLDAKNVVSSLGWAAVVVERNLLP